MIRIQTLRQQHDAAIAMADRLLELINGYQQPQRVFPITMQLNRLLGLIRLHLAYEDAHLYPLLLESGNPDVARTARKYVDEMGGLAAEFEQFARYWSCSASISGAFDEFREGVLELIMRLAVRVEREGQIIFPLAEELLRPKAA